MTRTVGRNSPHGSDRSVGIAGQDRAGLERLLRYCARPPFALERLEQVNEHQIIYQLPKPRRDGRTVLMLTPLELIDHLAALIPPPRLHRHRYHGVLAPNSPLRAAATAYAREHAGSAEAAPSETDATPACEETGSRASARYLWAMLLARLVECLPLTCPSCGAHMRIVAFITEAAPVERILTHIGQPAQPPPIAPARGPPAWDDALAARRTRLGRPGTARARVFVRPAGAVVASPAARLSGRR